MDINNQKKLHNQLAVVIHSCDDYQRYWPGWYHSFVKYWNFKLPFPVYFLTELNTPVFSHKRIRIYKTGKGAWSDRLKKFLLSKPYPHIFYLQEDMWMIDSLSDFTKYYKDFINYQMSVLRLCPLITHRSGTTSGISVSKFNNNYYKFNHHSKWLLSHQPSIWKKNFFIKYLLPEQDPWTNEIQGTNKIRQNKDYFKIFMKINIHDWYYPVSENGRLCKTGFDILKDLNLINSPIAKYKFLFDQYNYLFRKKINSIIK